MLLRLRSLQGCSAPTPHQLSHAQILRHSDCVSGEARHASTSSAKNCRFSRARAPVGNLTLYSRELLKLQRQSKGRVREPVPLPPLPDAQRFENLVEEGQIKPAIQAVGSPDAPFNKTGDEAPKEGRSPLTDLANVLSEEKRWTSTSTGVKFVHLASWPRQESTVNAELVEDQRSTWEQLDASGELDVATEDSEVDLLPHSSMSFSAGRAEVAPNLDEIHTSWFSRFQRMTNGRGSSLRVLDNASLGDILHQYASVTKSVRRLQHAWKHLPHQEGFSPIMMWEDLMIWCLDKAPMRALKLLLATSRGVRLRPSRHVVGDCLEHISKCLIPKDQSPDPWVLQAIHHLVRKFVTRGNDPTDQPISVPDNVAYLLLKHSSDDDAQSLLRLFVDKNVSLQVDTLLHFLHKSIAWGTLSLSMRLLRSAINAGAKTSLLRLQAPCSKLIRGHAKGQWPYAIRIQIMTQILEMGIKPKIAMYNAMLLNAVESKDFSIAWQMYHVAKANDLAPDSTTFGTLIKGAKLIDDVEIYDEVFEEINKHKDALRDLRLLSDVFDVMTNARDLEFPRMLELYIEYCSLTPLKELGICEDKIATASDRESKVQWPTSHILIHMLRSYIKMHQKSDHLIKVYYRYRTLVEERHPLIYPLSRWDYIPNAFIKAFGTRQETIRHGPTIIQHMLESQTKKNDIHEKQHTTELTHSSGHPSASLNEPSRRDFAYNLPPLARVCRVPMPVPIEHKPIPPTVQTWTILAHAYFRLGLKSAAENVLRLMESWGLRGDQVTWNTMVDGYASLQDVDAAVVTVKRMLAEGHDTNVCTLKNLSKLWNRGRLVAALDDVLRKYSEVKVDKPKTDSEKRSEEEADRFLRDRQTEHAALKNDSLRDSIEDFDSGNGLPSEVGPCTVETEHVDQKDLIPPDSTIEGKDGAFRADAVDQRLASLDKLQEIGITHEIEAEQVAVNGNTPPISQNLDLLKDEGISDQDSLQHHHSNIVPVSVKSNATNSEPDYSLLKVPRSDSSIAQGFSYDRFHPDGIVQVENGIKDQGL